MCQDSAAENFQTLISMILTQISLFLIAVDVRINCTQLGLLHSEFAAKNLYVWLIFYGERAYLKKSYDRLPARFPHVLLHSTVMIQPKVSNDMPANWCRRTTLVNILICLFHYISFRDGN